MNSPTWSRVTTRYASQLSKNRGGKEDQTFTLQDGRVLGYAEYGHPNGFPLLYFHGYPSSRLEASAVDNLTKRLRLRILSPDRPGFGLSSFQPNRRIIDYPADIKAFAQHLQLSKFAVLGGSGGGPYALACAHTLPREMLSAVGVMAGAPPWEAGPEKMTLGRRWLRWAAVNTPTALRILTDGLVGLLRWIVSTGPITKRIDKWLESTSKGEQEKEPLLAAEEPRSVVERREQLLRLAFEGFAQGSAASVQEARLLSEQDWGFKFEDIDFPVKLWHGTNDADAPVEMIRYMANRLPHGVLKEFDETHFTLANHLEEILAEFNPDTSSNPKEA
ncbi:alpha/beta-hydrolase [Rhizodiscina lignyota]|uniref:Alpha/beta-hydrolase n=1 Tax=Rhizodiscina lignyota TaxID=1504668 RepID=A0A9P4M9I6_9PEZI|nr:alpha/beta-hydrolase [Rhizodiscina lignyota]